jgi:hypothetical protein
MLSDRLIPDQSFIGGRWPKKNGGTFVPPFHFEGPLRA